MTGTLDLFGWASRVPAITVEACDGSGVVGWDPDAYENIECRGCPKCQPVRAERGEPGRDNPGHADAVGGGHAPQGASSAAGNVADPQTGTEGSAAPVAHAPRTSRTIEERFSDFHKLNPHVAQEMLRLARARLDRGETFISVKALWEELRVSLDRAEEGGAGPLGAIQDRTWDPAYKLNNSFTALYARLIIKLEPRLASVIELRKRKGE